MEPEARSAAGGDLLRGAFEDGPLNRGKTSLSEKEKYRVWTVEQKAEIVLALAGHEPAVVALLLQISRQAIYRAPAKPPAAGVI